MDQVTKGIDDGIKSFTEKYELDKTIVDDLRQLLLDACKRHVKVVRAPAGGAAKTGRHRRKTGYNMYIKHQFEEAKATASASGGDAKTNSQELMTKFSKEWKSLSDEEKKPFIDMANEINRDNGAEPSSSNKSRPKKLSGYNLFYKEMKDEIKANLGPDEKLMTQVGAQWKALSKDEQGEWNKRAAEVSAEVNAE